VTEIVLATLGATEETWQQFPRLAKTETPRYVGRAVVALATDPNVLSRTGQFLTAGELAREYGFTDIAGRYIPPYAVH
jgi:hypothetical protein